MKYYFVNSERIADSVRTEAEHALRFAEKDLDMPGLSSKEIMWFCNEKDAEKLGLLGGASFSVQEDIAILACYVPNTDFVALSSYLNAGLARIHILSLAHSIKRTGGTTKVMSYAESTWIYRSVPSLNKDRLYAYDAVKRLKEEIK